MGSLHPVSETLSKSRLSLDFEVFESVVRGDDDGDSDSDNELIDAGEESN